MLLKAVGGGGGRGMRVVETADAIDAALAQCEREAQMGFGRSDVFAEQLLRRARHVEIQVLGDGSGTVVHLGERECSLQRRHQKLVEIAPCPGMSEALRSRLADAALRLATDARYRSLGTFEFLLDASAPLADDTNQLWSEILLSGPEHRRLLFTGVASGDGVTTMAAVAALGLARNLRRPTLLVETNVHRPGRS